MQVKRTNLKKPGSERTGHGLRVKFNPLALLLDASLEGEFDLVQRIIYEVPFSFYLPHTPCSTFCICTKLGRNFLRVSCSFFSVIVFSMCFWLHNQVHNPSTPNDEGITPLHNAVCAGHHHIVKFLLDFGVNVNAADSDGWWGTVLDICLGFALLNLIFSVNVSYC